MNLAIFKKSRQILIGVLAILLSSCGGGGGGGSTLSALDVALSDLIAQEQLTGDPSSNRSLPDISDPLSQLGKLLFFSKALSGDQDTACVSCHHPMLGGGDNLSIAIGVAAEDPELLGPGRLHDTFAYGYDGGPTMPRNVPSVFNLGMFDQALFWEGRLNSLGATPDMNGGDGLGIRTPDSPLDTADPDAGDTLPQAIARFPVLVHEEMRGFSFEAGQDNDAVRDHLAARLGNYGAGIGELTVNDWLTEFQSAFNSSGSAETLITYSNISKALGEYMRSQVFVDSPWRSYVEGDLLSISNSAKRGAVLFFTPVADGGANCASCHSGDFFTDELTHVIAVPQIGRGKGFGVTGDDDFGRFIETLQPTDMYAFRTPTLINVTKTGPWGHSGAFESLEAILRHHLNATDSVTAFDYTQLTQPGIQISNAAANTANALAQLQANRTASKPGVLQDVALTDQQVEDLLNFLATLTDPCVMDRACLSEWIPDANDPDPDNLRLNAKDQFGNTL